MAIKQKLKSPMAVNFISLVLLQGVNYLLPLISFPFLFRVLGVERWGLVTFGYSLMQYFVMFTDFGFNLSATKYISQHRSDPRHHHRQRHVPDVVFPGHGKHEIHHGIQHYRQITELHTFLHIHPETGRLYAGSGMLQLRICAGRPGQPVYCLCQDEYALVLAYVKRVKRGFTGKFDVFPVESIHLALHDQQLIPDRIGLR